MALTYAQIEQVWLSAAQGTQYDTQTWAALMAAIAMAESSGNPDATNPTDNGGTQTSWGLWQISLGNHNAPAANWNDPTENAKLAIGKLETQGLKAWGTYNSGAYKQYYSGSTPASTGAIPGGGSAGSSGGTVTTGVSIPGWVFWTLPWLGGIVSPDPLSSVNAANPLGSLISMSDDLAEFMKWVAWMFSPSNWLRIGAFFVGIIAMLGAGYMFKESL